MKLFIKRLLLLLVLTLSFESCAITTNNKDENWMKERLVQREKEFQESFIKINPKKMWKLFSDNGYYKKNYNKKDFCKNTEEGLPRIFAEYFKIDYSIEEVDIRNTKAVVKVKKNKYSKDNKTSFESLSFDYWVFEDGDWFLDNFGDDSSKRLGWWKDVKKIDNKDHTERDKSVIERVNMFHNSRINGDFEKVWDLYADKLKTGAGIPSQEEFVKLSKATHKSRYANYISYTIEEIETDEESYRIKGKYLLKNNVEEIVLDTWVYENGNWYLFDTGTFYPNAKVNSK